MQAIDAIRITLKFSEMAMKHLGEMRDAPLLRPGPWGGNHAMWITGHLAVVEGRFEVVRNRDSGHARRGEFQDVEPLDDVALDGLLEVAG